MELRILGAVRVFAGCGSVGFLIAAGYRLEERTLRQLLSALDFMQCELQYRLTPLPELCRKVGAAAEGYVRAFFLSLAIALEDQIRPDVERCVSHGLAEVPKMPALSAEVIKQLGVSLGRFDLNGQIRGLEAARTSCRSSLERLTKDKSLRLRSYQTLGLCTGAALAILFI